MNLLRAFAHALLLSLSLSVAPMTIAAGKHDAPLAVGASFGDDGRLWRVRVLEGHLVAEHSGDLGKSFSSPVRVTPVPEPIAAVGELRPEIVAHGHHVYVAWTSPLPVPYAGHIRFARSLDGGRSFEAPITVNDNRDAITHRFQSLHVADDGRITLVWIDKRDLEAVKRAGKPYRGAAIYYAVSDDRGASFQSNVRLAAHSCECCRIALASDTDGRPAAFWRHVFADGARDHALMRIEPPTGEAPRTTREQWKIDACPHHGPALAIAADGTRYGAWFSHFGGEPGLFFGAWGRNGAISRTATRFGPPNAAHPALLLLGQRLLLAWKYFDGERTQVAVMESSDGGAHWSAQRILASAEGVSDHPYLLASGGRAYLSWVGAKEGYRLIPVEDGAAQ